jgi:hypothetical protein
VDFDRKAAEGNLQHFNVYEYMKCDSLKTFEKQMTAYFGRGLNSLGGVFSWMVDFQIMFLCWHFSINLQKLLVE